MIMYFFKDMQRNFKKSHTREYYPWIMAISASIGIYILLGLLATSEVVLATYWWYYGIFYSIIGIGLQLLSKRLLWTRVYGIIGFLSITILSLLLVWLLFTENQSLAGHFIAIGVLGLFVGGNILLEYRNAIRQTGDLGYGITGCLNVKTGLVDPFQMPPSRQYQIERARQIEEIAYRLIPLAAGLSMFLVNVLSEQGMHWLIMIAALVFLWLGTTGIGRLSYYIRWIIHWERLHDRPIMVKR